ncbi:MAG: N-acetylmuramoyl-L-alanine amidase-like domain-containing protein [Candidatus Eisenbacteria bacterium]
MIGALLLLSLALTREASPLLDRPDPAAIDSLLRGERWAALTTEEKLLALAPLRVGTLYALGCLGEEAEPDTDPLFRLDRADCTVLVVTDAALVHARSLDDARTAIRRIHYRDGTPSYAARYHFTTDRISSSPFFEEITSRAGPDSLLQAVRVFLNRKENGEPLLPIPWEREMIVRYLPCELLNEEVLDRLPPACGVAFVAEKNVRNGFLVSHEGLLLGRRTLHHASAGAGRVVEVPLLAYLQPSSGAFRFDGVLFFAFR